MYVCMCIVYIYRERERAREREKDICIHNTLSSNMCIYIYIYRPADAPPGPSRRAPARVLEVGVCDGSGAAVWSEYFGHPDIKGEPLVEHYLSNADVFFKIGEACVQLW